MKWWKPSPARKEGSSSILGAGVRRSLTCYSQGNSEYHGKQSGDDDDLVCPWQTHRVLRCTAAPNRADTCTVLKMTRCGTSSQCSSLWRMCVRPSSNFRFWWNAWTSVAVLSRSSECFTRRSNWRNWKKTLVTDCRNMSIKCEVRTPSTRTTSAAFTASVPSIRVASWIRRRLATLTSESEENSSTLCHGADRAQQLSFSAFSFSLCLLTASNA